MPRGDEMVEEEVDEDLMMMVEVDVDFLES